MTEQYYVAVKASIYSSDSAVFGLTPEELSAITKRHGHSPNKNVINGVLIKANPLMVINSLSELGYRVVCTTGEGEVLWTLRRDVLNSEKGEKKRKDSKVKRVSWDNRDSVEIPRRNSGSQESEAIKKENEAIRIGRNLPPEEEEVKCEQQGSRIVLVDPTHLCHTCLNVNNEKILLKTNLSSEDNPFSTRANSHLASCNENSCNFQDLSSTVVKFVQVSPITTGSLQTAMSDKCTCNTTPLVASVHQTVDEMDFERGLWYAALTGDSDRVRILLNKGHCANAEDKNGYTALHYAARCGYTTVCVLLLEAGANVNATTRAGQSTPLHRAALAGRDEVVNLLLKYKADPWVIDADGRNVLHRAVEGGNSSTITLLLKLLPRDLVDAPDKSGKTPRTLAGADPKLEQIFDSASSSPQ